jgi:hypothetical protein
LNSRPNIARAAIAPQARHDWALEQLQFTIQPLLASRLFRRTGTLVQAQLPALLVLEVL